MQISWQKTEFQYISIIYSSRSLLLSCKTLFFLNIQSDGYKKASLVRARFIFLSLVFAQWQFQGRTLSRTRLLSIARTRLRNAQLRGTRSASRLRFLSHRLCSLILFLSPLFLLLFLSLYTIIKAMNERKYFWFDRMRSKGSMNSQTNVLILFYFLEQKLIITKGPILVYADLDFSHKSGIWHC